MTFPMEERKTEEERKKGGRTDGRWRGGEPEERKSNTDSLQETQRREF